MKDPPQRGWAARAPYDPFLCTLCPPRETEPASLATRMRVPGD